MLRSWDFWRSIGSPKYVCAPMVEQSELAFRMLTRQLGADLCYTPMLHARLMGEVPEYHDKIFDPHPQDRPVFAQLAGHDPKVVLNAAQMVEDAVDAVDLNFGCPQGIARKGRYGAFLLEEPDVAVSLVETLAQHAKVPVTAKVRLLPSLEASMELCLRLQDAGASVLCVHGRTRQQNKQSSGAPDWSAIAALVERLDVPVIANGGIGSRDDADRCLAETGAAAVMSSEGLLECPALFSASSHPTTGQYLDQTELAAMYLETVRRFPSASGAEVRSHLFKMLYAGLRTHTQTRDMLLTAETMDDFGGVVDELRRLEWEQPGFHTDHFSPHASWYWRHRVEAEPTAEAEARAASAEGAEGRGDAEEDPAVARARAESDALQKRARRAAEKRRRRTRRKAGRAEGQSGGWSRPAVKGAAVKGAAVDGVAT